MSFLFVVILALKFILKLRFPTTKSIERIRTSKRAFCSYKKNDVAHQRSMENLMSTMQTVYNAIVAGMSSLTQALRQPYPLATDQGPWSDTRNTLHPYTYLKAASARNFPFHADARNISSEDKEKTDLTLQ